MTSRNVILLGAVLATFGAALPLAAAAYLSWQLALNGEQERLSALAERLITRINMTIDDAGQALETINATDLVPCSEPHIAEMRALTTTGTINEVGYFVGGLLKCTSWGITKTPVPMAPADFTTANGIAITAPFQSSIVSDGRPVMGFQLGSYSVLVDPQRFVDVNDDTSSGLVIAHENGTLISANNIPNPALLASLVASPGSGMDDGTIFSVAGQNGWLTMATSPRSTILAGLQRQLLVLLPIGIAIAALIVGAIIWVSRKRLSPASELARAVRNREFCRPLPAAHRTQIRHLRRCRSPGALATA
ncbi:Sensor/EAL domain-containing putative signal transduction protein [Devosia sp. LC5]|uniref:CSS-motif domain-containing protein n=1 Tax=Devosia sp. LC5 TaxID=1502724 RepID=UPI0004E4162F|nr:Sensor/EAL domain-containing putative signal transduction protein [Devosia sp. LC5]